MIPLKPMLTLIGITGLLFLVVSIAGMIVVALTPGIQAAIANPTNGGAWIGFWGSIAGSVIALLAASIAIIPAYRQAGEAQRATAVQSGLVLRARYVAVRDELFGVRPNKAQEVRTLLTVEPTITREEWLQFEGAKASRLRLQLIPALDAIMEDLALRNMGVELPDLDRGRYMSAIQNLAQKLRTVLDGIPRADNGEPGPALTDEQWRAHLGDTIAYAEQEVPSAMLEYNNRLSVALQVLRRQIILSDRTAMGASATADFDQAQKMVLK